MKGVLGVRGVLGVLGVLAVGAARAGEPSLKDVLRLVTAYVESYGAKASIVVATERYTQTVASTRAAERRREIVADFAIVRTHDSGEKWLGFRDVVEVDGRPVRDREDRLIHLLTGPSGGLQEAARLSEESSRFNIGGLLRTFNVPTTTLFFFRAETRDRFKFSRKAVAGGVWEIAFREVERPTLVRTPEGRSLPSEGTLWVRPEDGTIVRTQLKFSDFARDRVGSSHGEASISVIYRLVDAVGLWLPASMTELYEGSRGNDREIVRAQAEYSDYRVFTTFGRIK